MNTSICWKCDHNLCVHSILVEKYTSSTYRAGMGNIQNWYIYSGIWNRLFYILSNYYYIIIIMLSWDNIRASSIADTLLETAPNSRARARLLASSARESGVWLNALPISSLGLRMDNDTIRVAVGLRLGAPLCRPHRCHHCGLEVDALATHGFSCRQSQGRHNRHAGLNNIIHRSLTSAKVPSRLEPSGLQRADGKRPDGVTVVPWKCGKLLVWDATSPDTFALSYIPSATSEAGAVAALAEGKKKAKYSCLDTSYSFAPVAIESSGVFGPLTLDFLRDLGNRIKLATGEEKSFMYLLQRLSVEVQRGNTASVLGTTTPSSSTDIFF